MALRQGAGSLLQRLAAAPLEGALATQTKELLGSGSFDGVRHASGQAVKQRIRAIKNIGKITKAMKMVAASKMRNAQVAVENSRGIVTPFLRLFGDHPAIAPPKQVAIAVTSDKGLCGGLNSNITKFTKVLMAITPEDSKQTLVTIGDKGRSQLSRAAPEKLTMGFQDTYKVRTTFSQAAMIAEDVLAQEPDAIKLLFNKFHSAISFKPTVATVLSATGIERQMTGETGSKLDVYDLEVAAEREDVLRDLAEFQLAATLYNAMLENNCSEHASRMSAMENSTKSAGEMLESLTLKYNRDRQANITTSLVEIISGAAALVDE
ncbi:ATP synthase subunit mitochondrial [Raphidocelis subcapitata]|uniref:ATP synthase subunit gamma n=1 Tax=Raphidocelis subcapitata TaxID=307507 RepID=A0A2V0P8M8_9CHLO|nr:ATP synthase subunit mitochondrial [Raphidocelis subcapitata]|eukprot:GBF94220.1 ATP synthase subunit mitochondrial [Raphidocelis subcapitata]